MRAVPSVKLSSLSVALCLCMALSITPLAGAHATDATGSADRNALDEILQQRLTAAGVSAGSLVVVRGGRIEFAGGFGVDGPSGKPVDPATTIFHAASNSKTVVATAVMQLVAEGRLDLHADVNRYLRKFQMPEAFGAPVTLGGLLTHSSGMDDHFLGGLARTSEDLAPLGVYLSEHLPSRVLPPSQRIIYSNHGLALAGFIVEEVSGESFATYAERHVFKPLAMTSSSFRQPPPSDIAKRVVQDVRGTAPLLNPYPAGSLVSTPLDMGRFIASQLGTPLTSGAPILPDRTRLEMLQQQFTPNPAMPGAVYGYFESEANGRRSLHHTGDGGHHSLIYLVPEDDLGFYLVYTEPRNADPSTPREEIAQDLIDLYLPPARPFRQPKPPPDFSMRAARFTGTFRMNQYSHHTIEKFAGLTQEISIADPGDGTLSASISGGAPIRLVESAPNLFRDPDGAYIAFHEDAAGAITGLSFSGAAVDDPGSADRLRWWETANVTLAFVVAVVALCLVRIVAGVVLRWRRRRHEQRSSPLAWRLSGWMLLTIADTVVVAVGSMLRSGTPITGVPMGVKFALVLVDVVAAAGVVLAALTARDIVLRRGRLVHRILLAPMATAALIAIPFLNYWNLIGLRY